MGNESEEMDETMRLEEKESTNMQKVHPHNETMEMEASKRMEEVFPVELSMMDTKDNATKKDTANTEAGCSWYWRKPIYNGDACDSTCHSRGYHQYCYSGSPGLTCTCGNGCGWL